MPTILNAPSGEDTSSDGTEAIPVSGSKYMLVSTIAAYIRTLAQTLTNKTIDLASNTLTGTKAQFNTAMSDADFATLTGSETLTNKTIALGSNTVSGTTAQFNTALSDGDFATLAGTEALTNKTLTTPTISGAITFPDNVRQTFNPGADAAGLNVGSHAGDPGTPSNGDVWYDSTANELTARINGANVALGAAGGGSVATDAIWDAKGDLAGGTGANTAARLAVGTNGQILSADSGETTGLKWITNTAGGLTNSNISPTTSNQTAAVNTRYFADVSGLTANRNFILPAGTVGDIIELNIKVGDTAFAFIVIGDTGISINGGSTATEWSRLFITGENIRLVADTTSNWQIVTDGRKPCIGKMMLSAADTTNSAATDTLPTWDTKVLDVGEVCDTTNFRFNIRRAGKYYAFGGSYPNGSVTDQQYYYTTIKQGSTAVARSLIRASGAGGNMTPTTGTVIDCAVADEIYLYYTSQAANMGITNASPDAQFNIVEQF